MTRSPLPRLLVQDIPQECEDDCWVGVTGEFRPRQTRQLPRAVDLKGRLLSYQSY